MVEAVLEYPEGACIAMTTRDWSSPRPHAKPMFVLGINGTKNKWVKYTIKRRV
jgi:hypothetical protein